MKTEKVEAILSAPTVTLKELLNKPELLEGKEGFWFFTPYAFPNPAGPVAVSYTHLTLPTILRV